MKGFAWRQLRDPEQERGNHRRHRAELTAMVLDNSELRDDGRRVCENNLLALCYVLGYCLIDEHVHHEALHFFPEKDSLNQTSEEMSIGIKRRRTLMYPRNTYKSTLDIANCVQIILHYYMTIAILILSGNKDLAYAFVNEVASHFVKPYNRAPSLFQALYPELCISKQPESGEFTAAIRQREPEIKEPLIWGNSVAASTTGWHPDILILDDVHTNLNSRSFESRERVTKAYKLIRKVLKPTGYEIKIGTPYGPGDVFNDEVINSKPGTYERIFKPAMRLKNGERLDPNGFPAEDEVELLFPSILSYDFLREEYDGDYDSFMSQYMLDSYGSAEVVFTEQQMIDAVQPADTVPLDGKVFIHWRLPARSLGWLTAAFAVGIMQRNRMYIIAAHEGHYKPSVLARLMHDTARTHGQHTIHVEDSPGARAIHVALNNYALTTGWEIRVTWTESEPTAGDRDTRIRHLETLLASSRLRFSDELKIKPLMTGFCQYGMIPSDALPDVIARVADNLPVSIAADTEQGEEDLAWEMMREKDKYNQIYGRGQYAPSEPEPMDFADAEIEREEWPTHTESGLEVVIPGLE